MSVITFESSTGPNYNVNSDHIVLWYFEDDRLHITPSTGMGKLTSAILSDAEQVHLGGELRSAMGSA